MIRQRILFAFLFLLTIPGGVTAQYRMPMDLPLQLSGTFAELRSNHFHSGIDIRTQETEGFPVYAIEEGYVTRVFISPFGFGKAVYINHPGGITSVYAHLRSLSEPLASEAIRQQYAKQSFQVDFQLQRDKIRVSKGQIIGWSGNSGGSGGPHLHFELRRTSSQRPVNPMDYGYRVSDTVKPIIEAVRVYPLAGQGHVAGLSTPLTINANFKDTISVGGPIYLGINTYDQQDGAPSRDGPYMIRLYLDDELWWQIRFDDFSYDETRYVNAYIDYAEYINSSRRFQLTRRLPYNALGLYERIQDDGIINLSDTLLHRLRYEVSDYELNTTTFNILIRNSPAPVPSAVAAAGAIPISNRQGGEATLDGLRLKIPPKSFYTDSIHLHLTSIDPIRGAMGSLYQVHYATQPIHKQIDISLDINIVPPELRSKTLIVRVNNDNSLSYLTTKIEGGMASARIREFGRYTLMADTIAPSIVPENIADGKQMGSETQIRINVTDNQSGIVKYRATIDGQWVLLEYEPKLNLLFHNFDERCFPGEHMLKVEVTDDAGNMSVYSASFIR
jgi:hypothetical protein